KSALTGEAKVVSKNREQARRLRLLQLELIGTTNDLELVTERYSKYRTEAEGLIEDYQHQLRRSQSLLQQEDEKRKDYELTRIQVLDVQKSLEESNMSFRAFQIRHESQVDALKQALEEAKIVSDSKESEVNELQVLLKQERDAKAILEKDLEKEKSETSDYLMQIASLKRLLAESKTSNNTLKENGTMTSGVMESDGKIDFECGLTATGLLELEKSDSNMTLSGSTEVSGTPQVCSPRSSLTRPVKPVLNTQVTGSLTTSLLPTLKKLSGHQLAQQLFIDCDIGQQVGQWRVSPIHSARRNGSVDLTYPYIIQTINIKHQNQLDEIVRRCQIMARLNCRFVSRFFGFLPFEASTDKIQLVFEKSEKETEINLQNVMDLTTTGKIIPESVVCFYIAEFLLALECLHKTGVAFGFMPLEKVPVDSAGHVKLSPYSVSDTDNVESLSQDIFNLGIMIFELLTNGNSNFDSRAGRLVFPSYFSKDAANLISGLLQKDETQRLGCGSEGFLEIKRHAFFRALDWDKLAKREIKPPFVPRLV
ncbi:Serine/threonine-protein kinase Sgk1, partial [Blyttiomyces sp. JEL0837]